MSDSDRKDEGNQMNDRPEKGRAVLMDCVLNAGAAMIRLRHIAKSPEDAKKVGSTCTTQGFCECYADVKTKVMVAIDELTDLDGLAIPTMRFGKGLRLLDEAEKCARGLDMWGAFVRTMEAHDSFERVLTSHRVATPTNKEIAGVIALANRR